MSLLTYRTATATYQDELWASLATKTIEEAMRGYLNLLTPHTKRCYEAGFRKVFDLFEQRGLISRNASLQTFSLSNMENLLDCIKIHLPGSPSTKQTRCGMFVAFTRFLERATKGMIRSAKPIVGTLTGTFKKIRNKAHTESIIPSEWRCFLKVLETTCFRDYLIAKMLLQGAKRISEVLGAHISQINWEANQIRFHQAKGATLESTTTISFSKEFMEELRGYLDGRDAGFIFITRSGHPVSQPHIYRSFAGASVQAGLSKRIHPHMLRTTAITMLMNLGYHSDEIMKVSGHTTPTMVLYYDKSAEEDNPTKYTKLC